MRYNVAFARKVENTKKKFNFILGDIMMQLWEIMLKLSDIKSQFWDTV